MRLSRPALALGLTLLLAAPAGLAAQQEDGDERERSSDGGERPGWIGVGIQETLDCGPRRDETEPPEAVPTIEARGCRRVLVTEAVFEGGPAAEAGMQPGDTLVAVNGQPLSERRGARELGSLRPDEPIAVLVGREEGRVSLRVTPEPRPAERGPAPVLVPGSPSLFVQPGDLDRLRRIRAEIDRAPEIRLHLEDGHDISGTLKVDEQGRVYLEQAPHKLVRLKGVELPPGKVEALRDSALARARARLREVRAELRTRAAAPPEPAPEPGTERIRMLGAEFLALSSDLAGNLRGVEAGLLVLRVVPGTPAARMGLRPGDVVVEAGGGPVSAAADLRAPFAGTARGDSVVVRWVRRGEEMRGALQRP